MPPSALKIDLLVPTLGPSRSGNSVTAQRYREHLEALGHDVHVAERYRRTPADLLIALNAYRNASSIREWRERFPQRSLVVVLTGTDLYRFMKSDAATVLGSLNCADRIIGLNSCVADSLPEKLVSKLTIIHSGAAPIDRQPDQRAVFGLNKDGTLPPFHAVVVGHLRAEKDPLRAAEAARGLPPSSQIQVHQFGAAYDEAWAERVQTEAQTNTRFHWHGEVTGAEIVHVLVAADVIVISSELEGGANVLSEAIMAELAVIASRIPGNVGVLGPAYAGYFPVGDTQALRQALLRCEQDSTYLDQLRTHLTALKPKVSLQQERECLGSLLTDLGFRADA